MLLYDSFTIASRYSAKLASNQFAREVELVALGVTVYRDELGAC